MDDCGVSLVPATWTRYSKLQTIGAGSYGQVYLGEGNVDAGGTPGIYVVKRVQVADLPDDEMRGAINEVQVLSLLDHCNVVGYIDHFVDSDGFLNIVMEHCSQGDLSKQIDKRKQLGSHFKQSELAFWAFQLAQGMKYIHSIGIIHRDLKPANIFLTSDNTLRIADFGISKLVSASSVAQTVIGTPFYIAPEICENQGYTNKADVWSAGCVLYELASLEKPFNGSNILAVVKKVTDGKYQPLHKRYAKLSAMVARMLVVDSEKRASITELIDEFFTGRAPSLPAPSVEGLSPKDIQATYAQWATDLNRKENRETSPKHDASPRRRSAAGGSSKKKDTAGSGAHPESAGGNSRGKQRDRQMPDLEIHLLPSQRCLLVDDSINSTPSGNEKRGKGAAPGAQQASCSPASSTSNGKIVFRTTGGSVGGAGCDSDSGADRPIGRSGNRKDSMSRKKSKEGARGAKKSRPASGKRKKEKKEKKQARDAKEGSSEGGAPKAPPSHNATMSTTVTSGSSSAAADDDDDNYSLDDFENAEELSPCDSYSNESFEQYQHDTDQDLASPGPPAEVLSDASAAVKISDQDWHNICLAREIDRNTDQQASKLRQRREDL
eukprot:TRINITY_DN34562_c0_g1_i1.p1 TRINITY_DN34562_c0_g1~~TRINITY_DN34562_c0_g1_i1.p1  ORF type:complete len:607 (+),score=142.20 TRINITY_DN34562_c0_g1_i1:202-2022(+)